MSVSRAFLCLVLIVGGVALSAGRIVAGSVKGTVLDRVNNKPEVPAPVFPAHVKLLDRKTGALLPNEVLVNKADGTYEIPDVPSGNYTVVVSAVGYAPNGTPVPDTDFTATANGATAPDAKLIRVQADGDYFAAVAAAIEKVVSAAPADKQTAVLTKEWRDLAAINLPPTNRVMITQELGKKDNLRLGVRVPEVKDYLKVKPKDVHSAQEIYGEVMEGKIPQPSRITILEELHLTPDLVADVAIYHLKQGAQTPKLQAAFREDFLRTWKDTSVAKKVLGLEKQGFFKPALINSP